MDWLNYHHLRYFAVVAREGSIAAASRVLHTSPPAISTQLRRLERSLGEKLFEKQGRGLRLTDTGRLVQGYADQIFGLGAELQDAVRDRPTGRPLRVQIGVADVVPKDLACRLLEPLLLGEPPIRPVVTEDRTDRLLAELALFHLDLVIADAPIAAGSRVKAYHHLLGECAVGVFGSTSRRRAVRQGFPGSLAGQPFVLPLPESELRREFDAWLRQQDLAVEVVAEIEDQALARPLAAAAGALLLAPVVLAEAVQGGGGLGLVGEIPSVRCRYYAITVERRVRHPAVARVLARARDGLFG